MQSLYVKLFTFFRLLILHQMNLHILWIFKVSKPLTKVLIDRPAGSICACATSVVCRLPSLYRFQFYIPGIYRPKRDSRFLWQNSVKQTTGCTVCRPIGRNLQRHRCHRAVYLRQHGSLVSPRLYVITWPKLSNSTLFKLLRQWSSQKNFW